MFRSFFRFGEQTVNTIILQLFYVGSLLISFGGIVFSRSVYLDNTFMKKIEHYDGTWYTYTYEEVHDLPLAIIAFITYTILLILLWRIVCELLFILFDKIKDSESRNR